MQIKPDQLLSHLSQKLAPVYLVAGDEELLVQEAADAVREQARKSGFLERDILTMERGFKWDKLSQAGESMSLFAEKKIIDLRLPTGKPGRDGGKALTQWCENPDADNLLLVSCPKWDTSSRKSKWAQTLAKTGVYVEIWPIKPQELPRWLAQRMQTLGLQPENGVVELLAERLEGNLLAAAQEVHKLWLLKGAAPISLEDIKAWVVDSARFDVYRLIECGLNGQGGQACRIISSLKSVNSPPPLLVGALVRELNNLYSLRQVIDRGQSLDSAFSQMRIWRTRQAPIQSALRRLDLQALAGMLQQLQLLDRLSKGQVYGCGLDDFWVELDQLFVSLTHPIANRAA